MKNKKNVVLYSLLALIIILTLLLGLFTDWEQWYYTPFLIIAISMFIIRLISNQLKESNKIQNYTFIWISLINFAIYSIASFYHYSGGITGITIVLPILFFVCLVFSYLYNRIDKKSFIVFSDIFIVVVFIFAILMVMGGMALAGMGV
ncbi:MAG: hypothetical protein K8Q99_04025 [Acholeplasmataceae bacterium]|nr:hypothetical protein [Acholeplasmataceae bacterium]